MTSLRKIVVLASLMLAVMLPCAVSLAALHKGDSGDAVYELQDRLAHLRYEVSADGAFGPATEAAVRKFQQDHGLEADGVVGEGTWDALHRLTPTVSRASRPVGDRIIAIARQYIGTPYYFGGVGPDGFDCSGFTQYVFRKAGIGLYRAADEQFEQGRAVSRDSLRTGDLVFFSTYAEGASHVGIYMNNGYFIHAGSSTGVTISHINDSYWGIRYIGAKRVIR